jgi:hypothetical protein
MKNTVATGLRSLGVKEETQNPVGCHLTHKQLLTFRGQSQTCGVCQTPIRQCSNLLLMWNVEKHAAFWILYRSLSKGAAIRKV